MTIATGRDHHHTTFVDEEERRNVANNSVPFEQQVKTVNKSDTVTTVPQLQQKLNKLIIKSNSLTATAKQGKTSASLSDNGASMPSYPQTALDKFNQIIDETMLGTNEYPVQQPTESMYSHIRYPPLLSDSLKNRLATHYPNFVANNSISNFNTFNDTITRDRRDANVEIDEDSSCPKRKDVNYLLKQFNSFSDIEKVEFLDSRKKQSKYQILFNAQYRSTTTNPYDIRDKHQLQSSVKQQILNTNNFDRDILVSSKSQPLVTKISEKLHSSPSATSLILYSPSAQSHKRIRRYASLQQAKELSQPETLPYQHIEDHYYHHHQNRQDNRYVAPVRACIAHVANVAMLQQFVDDYMFQSCHYLEMNNFTSNYRTAMVESSSHEFRPSITTNTCTSEELGHEKASSNQSFELNEVNTSNTYYKLAHAPCSPVLLPRKQYASEKRTYAVQTDLTTLSLSQNSAWSSSGKSSPSSTTKYKPLFKCCYTPLDMWREKRAKSNNIPPLKTIKSKSKHRKPS